MPAFRVKCVYYKPSYCLVEVFATDPEEAAEKALKEVEGNSGDYSWTQEGDWEGPVAENIDPICCQFCSSQLETIDNKWNSKLKGYVCNNCNVGE